MAMILGGYGFVGYGMGNGIVTNQVIIFLSIFGTTLSARKMNSNKYDTAHINGGTTNINVICSTAMAVFNIELINKVKKSDTNAAAITNWPIQHIDALIYHL